VLRDELDIRENVLDALLYWAINQLGISVSFPTPRQIQIAKVWQELFPRMSFSSDIP